LKKFFVNFFWILILARFLQQARMLSVIVWPAGWGRDGGF